MLWPTWRWNVAEPRAVAKNTPSFVPIGLTLVSVSVDRAAGTPWGPWGSKHHRLLKVTISALTQTQKHRRSERNHLTIMHSPETSCLVFQLVEISRSFSGTALRSEHIVTVGDYQRSPRGWATPAPRLSSQRVSVWRRMTSVVTIFKTSLFLLNPAKANSVQLEFC